MYLLSRQNKINIKEDLYLIGYFLFNQHIIYIYVILSKNNHKIMYNTYNKNLFSNIKDVMLYLQKIKENKA